MEEFFRFIGKKSGQVLRRGKWIYKSVLGSEEEAIEAEYFVGKEIAGKVSQMNNVDSSPEIQKLLDDIGLRLVDKVKNRFRKFSFSSIISQDVNAFALPGGFIFTTDSILKLCNFNEDEVAFILGHEIGHIVRWHIFNRTIANSSLNLISMVSKPGGLVGSLAVRTINNLMQNGYSRDQEFEADSFGIILMYAAGFNYHASINFFEKLAEFKSDNSSFYNYFSTHPPIQERIKRMNYIIRTKIEK